MKKILLGVGLAVALIAIIVISVVRAQSGSTKVLTSKVVRQDLSSVVSGTGQIKPKTYANIGAETMGRITQLYVKEGDRVKRGQMLAKIENIQPQADVETQKATIASSRTDFNSYVAAEKTAEANLESAKATLEQKELDWKRGQSLYQEKLIPKSDYDSRKAAYDVAAAAVLQNQAAVAQSKAQSQSAASKIKQAESALVRYKNVLDRTVALAPFDAIVTNLPVREGETVVVGIQNAEGSTLMTLADMSVITAEVKVDETDIVNIALGQPADVTVDALPGRVFKGHVTLVGDQAILRSTGIATSQSTTGTEEAKDFKVVVTLDSHDDALRPGLSTTAKITTAHKENVLTLPIQALTMQAPEQTNSNGQLKQASATNAGTKAEKQQGVFLVRDEKGKLTTTFVAVTTGITGATEIEVTGGLKENDEVVIGPFKTLRALKAGTHVKRDKTPPTQTANAS